MAYYKKYMNQGPAYYGDLDEADGQLLKYEQEAEEEGALSFSHNLKLEACILFVASVFRRLGRSLFKSPRNTTSTI